MRRRRRLRTDNSFAERIMAQAAMREQRHAEQDLLRQRRALARMAARLTGPPRVDRRGAFGRAAGRVGWPLRLPPLVTTSAQLCSVYPFVVDPGLSADGPLIGTEVYSRAAFCFSLHELYRAKIITAPNMVVTGEIGAGKSALLKTMAFRGQPVGVRFFITDVKGEYDGLARLTGVRPLRVGPGLGRVMNPLAPIVRHPAQSEQQWLQVQRARRLLLLEGLLEIELRSPLAEAERSLVEYALDAVTRAEDGTSAARMPEPTLSGMLHAATDPQRWAHRLQRVNYPADAFVADSRRVRLALERTISGVVGGVFDGPTTASAHLDWAQAGTVLDLRDVRGSDQLTAMVTGCAQSWLEAEIARPDAPARVCFYDEFALLGRHLTLMRRMREQVKLARLYGIANVLALHRFTDLAAGGAADSEQVRIARGLIEDTGVRVSYRQEPGSVDQAREFLATTAAEAALLPELPDGVGLWKIGGRGFVVKHQLSAAELPMVYTGDRMDATPQTPRGDGAAGVDAVAGGQQEVAA